MEGREGLSAGITAIGAEAPSAYHVAQGSENLSQGGGPPVNAGLAETTVKKRRGRPRKYGSDGTVNVAFSPLPISSSAPPGGDFSSGKRGKRRLGSSEYKHHKKVGLEYIDYWNASSIGTNFMPHIITVNAGEDVAMKIMSFSQQGPRAICVLSANGVISNVTLRQPDSSGGTLTYEGRFEILSLSGSFTPTECEGTRSRSGGMSVSLVNPDGRVVGGGVAGLLIAASPVQLVVASFLPINQREQNIKKQNTESTPATVTASASPPSSTLPTSATDDEDVKVGNAQQSFHTI